ncbi:hypothetical protein ACFOHK_08505 [Falsigemmobacter intermedius]|nr:hypothetical protein [Falsigemmobacter intermedius]
MTGFALKNRRHRNRLQLFLDVNLDRILVPGLLFLCLSLAVVLLEGSRPF